MHRLQVWHLLAWPNQHTCMACTDYLPDLFRLLTRPIQTTCTGNKLLAWPIQTTCLTCPDYLPVLSRLLDWPVQTIWSSSLTCPNTCMTCLEYLHDPCRLIAWPLLTTYMTWQDYFCDAKTLAMGIQDLCFSYEAANHWCQSLSLARFLVNGFAWYFADLVTVAKNRKEFKEAHCVKSTRSSMRD